MNRLLPFFQLSILSVILISPATPFLCQSGTALGKVLQPDNELNCIGALIERCSVVYTNNNGNEIWVHGCASSSNKCGTVVREGLQYQNYCCCETENCNDANFAEKCSVGVRSAVNVVVIVVVVVVAIVYIR